MLKKGIAVLTLVLSVGVVAFMVISPKEVKGEDKVDMGTFNEQISELTSKITALTERIEILETENADLVLEIEGTKESILTVKNENQTLNNNLKKIDKNVKDIITRENVFYDTASRSVPQISYAVKAAKESTESTE